MFLIIIKKICEWKIKTCCELKWRWTAMIICSLDGFEWLLACILTIVEKSFYWITLQCLKLKLKPNKGIEYKINSFSFYSLYSPPTKHNPWNFWAVGFWSCSAIYMNIYIYNICWWVTKERKACKFEVSAISPQWVCFYSCNNNKIWTSKYKNTYKIFL